MALKSSTSLTDEPGAAEVTFGGRLALNAVTPYRTSSVWFSTLGGTRVSLGVPHTWQIRGVSAWTAFERAREGAGFQRAPRGTALIDLLGLADRMRPESLVKVRDGLFAHYRIGWDDGASASFTLWQGPYSDVYSWSRASFDEALDEFTRFAASDAPAGAVIACPHGFTRSRDEVVVDCGVWAVEIRKRIDSFVPLWPGARGAHVELYRSEQDAMVVAVSPTAFVEVSRTGDEPITDDDVAQMAGALRVHWQ